MSLYDSTGLYDQSALTYDAQTPGIAGLPNIGVFIAFNDSPYAADPAWTEVTQYVRNIPSIRRARSDEWSTFTGSASLTLDNRDQRFNPYNTAGAYYGKLLPRRQIKIVADVGEYTNLVINPSFETNATNWGGNGTLTRVTTDAYIGTTSYQQVHTAVTANQVVDFSSDANRVTAGRTYTASVYVKNTAGTNREMYMTINWQTSVGGAISTTTGLPSQVDIGAGWVRLSVTGTAPATATQFRLDFFTQSTNGAVGNTTLLDAAMVTETYVPIPYFDGSQSSCIWTGTANASTSTKSVLMSLFRGYIAGWPVEWSNNDEDSTVDIECFDILSLLQDQKLPEDWSAPNLPGFTFLMNDPETTNVINSSVSGWTATQVAGSLPFRKVEPLAIGISRQATYIGQDNTYRTNVFPYGTIPAPVNNVGNFSLGFWWAPSLPGTLSGCFSADIAPWNIGFFVQADGSLTVDVYKNGTLYSCDSTTTPLQVYGSHHLAATWQPLTSTIKIYVDGNDVSGPTTSTAGGTTITNVLELQFNQDVYQDFFIERPDNSSVLSAAQINQIYEYGIGQYVESTTARANRYLNSLLSGSIPSEFRDFTSTPQGTVAQLVKGVSALDGLISTSLSEGGELYVSKEGEIVFTERNSQLKGRSATTQAMFKDDGTGLKYSGNFSIRFDADSVVNDLRYELSAGAYVSASDGASITAYGQATKNVTTQLSTLADAQSLANSRLAIFDTPIPQVSPLETGITRSLADWQALLELELMDQIEVTRTPKVGSVFADRLLVNEISHSISPEVWSMQVTGSARFSEWFTIGIDSIGGDRLIA